MGADGTAAVDGLALWVSSSLLLSLRVAPVFLFAPPFTLMRVPRVVLALFGIGLAALLASTLPEARLAKVDPGILTVGALREIALGLVPLLVLQLMFAALYLAGRTIDIQSGYGLALLIDPGTRAQAPLVGTLFGLVAGATFFAAEGHLELLRFFAASLEVAPLGTGATIAGLSVVGPYFLTVSLIALGIAGAAILALLLVDVAIAALSRTVPQMNALLLGIQVKALLLFALLPIAFGLSAALFVQLVASALSAMSRMI